MALPNTNISVTVVKNTLQEGTFDVSLLCKSNAINKWSKYKPFINAAPFFASENEWRAAALAAGYGLTSPSGVTNPLTAAGSTYTYNKPNPPNNPCRLGDFRSYNHTALPPMGDGLGEIIFNRLHATQVTISPETNAGDNYTISFADLGIQNTHKLRDCYLGFAVNFGGGNIWIKTNPNPILNSSGVCQITDIVISENDIAWVNGGSGGSFPYYIIAASAPKTTFGAISSSTYFYPMPFATAAMATGSFNIVKGLGAEIEVLGIGNYFGTIYPLNNFDPTQTPMNYFTALDNSNFYIQARISNTSGKQLVLDCTKFKIQGYPTLQDASGAPTGYIATTVCNNTNESTTYSTLTIHAGQSVTVKFRVQRLWNKKDGYPETGFSQNLLRVEAMLQFEYNNFEVAQSEIFGLSNQ